jgi:hypothetical protein
MIRKTVPVGKITVFYYHWLYFEFSDLRNIRDPEHVFKNTSSHHKYQRVWSRVFKFAKIKTKHINRLHVETVFVTSAYDNSDNYLFFFFYILGVGRNWVHLVLRPLTGLLYQPRMIDEECGAVGGVRIGRENRSTRWKPETVPLCPLQILHDLSWARTRAVAVGSRRLTAWAMARP